MTSIVPQLPNLCPHLHRMDALTICSCVLPEHHEGDCNVHYKNTIYHVSPFGYGDHVPIPDEGI